MFHLENFARAPLHVAARGANWVFPENACNSDSLAASVFTVPATPLPISADGSDLGLHAVSSEFPTSLHNDSALLPTPVATPASSTVVLNKAALGAIPRALSVHKDSVVRPMNSGPQAPSAVPHSASRVAEINHSQVPVAPAAPPLLPLPSQTALPSLLPSGLISSRACRSRVAAAGKPQAAVDCENRARIGASRLLRLHPGPLPTQFLLRRSNTPPTRPHLLRFYLVPSLRGTSAFQHPRRPPRDVITARNRVPRVCRTVLTHRLGA